MDLLVRDPLSFLSRTANISTNVRIRGLSLSLSSETIRLANMDEFELDSDLPTYKAMIAGAAAGVSEHICMFPVCIDADHKYK